MTAEPFAGIFRGMPVLVTGHTGFKGSWLCHWLLAQGAVVTGVALEPETTPNLFTALQLAKRLDHRLADVRDAQRMKEIVTEVKPTVVFHLAAQALVRRSYRDPKATWDINVSGTVNVLEAIRAAPAVRACVVVTSDKCYDNREWEWGYRECDALGGHDPYSASKAAAELVVASFRDSFFSAAAGASSSSFLGSPSCTRLEGTVTNCRLATARAGNVIGGGDWAAERILTDFVTTLQAGQPLRLRNPTATRPWQHVLEPLSGYLALAARLLNDRSGEFASAWNFGPGEGSTTTVAELADRLVAAWGSGSVICEPQVALHGALHGSVLHEAGLLKLDCSKARAQLGWHGIWGLEPTIAHTCDWYRMHANGGDIRALTDQQIATYASDARAAGVSWAG